MTKFADLHIHTYYSDSTSSPQEVIEQAKEKELSCIAIADHDTVEGVTPTVEEGKLHGIEVIPAIELSTEMNGRDIHLLGYLFDYKNPELLSYFDKIQDARIDRMKKMIAKLESLGITGIEYAEVAKLVKSKSLGRPHLAHVMVQMGKVPNMRMAFNKYLADDAPACVPHFKQTPKQAINLIHKYGGVTVLAHPMATNVDEMIPQLVRDGLDGLEVFYPYSSEQVTNFYSGIAKKHNLLVTGGSDAHGNAKKHTFVGKIKVPYEIVEQLKSATCKG